MQQTRNLFAQRKLPGGGLGKGSRDVIGKKGLPIVHEKLRGGLSDCAH